ncbi:glycolate oxidase subunit GlcE [Piscinibacter sp. Jin2]|uniref:Glycolate oxidase subunit GlcE n=1 Tax=Aquariibacter lacus TaxID=2801332 RepID=A0A9X0XBH8_9BURK|nr:glycolate oxidase subunit GlcE [Piscinibacter lacus]MBL0718514.1 glycolate oxidase subunit GlcE [Piscinibacter lacus]
MLPESTPELQALIERIRAAGAAGTPLAITGHGSKAFLGGAPHGEPLSTLALRGISSYEPTELVVTARAGTPLAELEAALAEQGQCLPFEPPRLPGADGQPAGTVGGMVAAGLAGPARGVVGSVRDYVLGATVVNGRGELLSFGGQVMKNVAGYDLARLLAGSMGELGLIAEVSLKVLPRPPATATLHFRCDEASALERLNRWAGRPLPLNASAWWAGSLLLRLSGAQAAVASASRTLAAEAGGEPVDPGQAGPFWDGLRDQRDTFFDHADEALRQGRGALWRLSLPATAAPVTGLEGEQLIEWGGAQRWWITAAAPATVRAAASRLGGHAQLWRSADPALRAEAGLGPLDPVLARLNRQVKASFDPAGVLSPGRLIAAA